MIISLILRIPNKTAVIMSKFISEQTIIQLPFKQNVITKCIERYLVIMSILVIIGCVAKIFMELEENKNVKSE